MQIDIQPLIQGLLALVLALATAAIPLLTRAALTWLHLDGQAGLADHINTAAETGAGLAYQALLSAGQGASDPVIKDRAVAIGAQYVLNQVSGAIAATNKDPASITALVDGHLGKLLALDPTIGPSVAAPPAQANAIAQFVTDACKSIGGTSVPPPPSPATTAVQAFQQV